MIQQDMPSSVQNNTARLVCGDTASKPLPPCTTPARGVDADTLRTRFVQRLSDMYRDEVPLYGDLVDIVASVDASVLASKSQTPSDLLTRHQLERHGAIRLGTAQEMRLISRLFRIMGMYPVGYYDLQIVGFPLHGTAFRPISEQSLSANPFRVFTTVLRPSLIASPTVRKMAESTLSSRQLFSSRLIELMDGVETAGLMPEGNVTEFISEALKIFKWHSKSTVSLSTYESLLREHPMVADIVCFPSAHINHLTPRTLDIDAVQEEMVRRGLPAKECIEGPPAGRKCEILLRQTSFKALEERVIFVGGDDECVDGTHTARFGEVEQRGAAVTKKGRELYDRLLVSAIGMKETERDMVEALKETFVEYPDDWETLRKQDLVFFRYKVVKSECIPNFKLDTVRMEELIQTGVVECQPITYEDFLPLSAAGIFTSNLGDDDRKLYKTNGMADGRAELEAVLGQQIPCETSLYEELQSDSVKQCEEALGLKRIIFE
ncbi:hypothetical protein QBC38DRAFT_167487 [Podospora fimiseda]|uniref:2-oxoadipate dioxygenase/decarboxylase n=1 Tax=Podospora fimiseda TaxID=252190 RepID=A0AAN7BS32_9PEZI|nr:hypothetical protein QBC38DRAFT_167487 [Podospora fimiseda]